MQIYDMLIKSLCDFSHISGLIQLLIHQKKITAWFLPQGKISSHTSLMVFQCHFTSVLLNINGY